VPYEYREDFEVDAGFRLFRDKVSVLLQSTSCGQRLSDQQNCALVRATNDFMDAIADPDFAKVNVDRATPPDIPLRESDFREIEDGPLYKYIRQDTLSFMERGSFQFGTAEYYRNSPNIKIRDRREGAGHFHLGFLNDQFNTSLISGYNCAVFCGTSLIDGPDDAFMRDQFGPHRIRIESSREFMSRASKCIGAHRARVYDVVYRDVQSYTVEFPDISRLLEIEAGGNFTSTSLRKLNREFFAVFYEYGLLPGLFAKPVSYSRERERRLIFETRKDLSKPIIVEDKRLLSFITFLD
jgi:hypothetical protein